MRTLLLRTRLSIARVRIGVLLAGLVGYPFAKEVGPDFWWQLRAGDLVLHSGIPATTPSPGPPPGTQVVAGRDQIVFARR